MYRANNRRLPGIRFLVEPPGLEEKLPRMDITAFVGFAASGPLDVPVAVEDMKRFRDIFGGDLALARDGKTGEQQYAHLAPVVEAYFKNGGKRCWVVRVAGTDAAGNCFQVPGLVEAETNGAVTARARSEGSWSDLLRVGTVLNRDPLTVLDFQCGTSAYSLEVVSVPGQVEVGDLVQIDGKFAGIHLVFFLAVDTVEVETETLSPPSNKYRLVQRIKGETGYWFKMTDNGLALLTETAGNHEWQTASSSSPPGETGARRLTFDLPVWDGETVTARMRRLGFYKKHPRFWAGLPTDTALFALEPGEGDDGQIARAGELEFDASEPRFPLAGPTEPAELYLPVAMAQLPDHNLTYGAETDVSADAALKRDGLETFDTAVFSDPDLIDLGIDVLIEEANQKYLLQAKREPLKGFHSLLPLEEVTVAAVPDAVHRGWERHPKTPVPWLDTPVLKAEESIETGSPLRTVSAPADGVLLVWSAAAVNALYTLQESGEPLFLNPVTVYKGKETFVPVVSCTKCARRYFYRVYARLADRSSPWSNTLDVTLPDEEFADCAQPALMAPSLEPVSTGSPGDGEYFLTWSEAAGASGYVVEESEDPTFAAGVVIYEGNNTSLSLTYRTGESRVYYFRVRAEGVVLAAWSNTRRLDNTGDFEWLLKSTEDYTGDRLLDLQHSLLRFCAARGDILAVLSLPRHYREEETLAHVEVLGAVKESEKRMLSFGALYHPWVLMGMESAAGGSAMRYVPPDGPVCGGIAARTLARGAWIAPANQPLQGVTALIPPIRSHYREKLYRQQVNIICDNPRGFLLFSADTLSPDTALQPINVRRLLILLRRLASREGMAYVFQPNNTDFHRRVKYRFEQMLARMYTRGAFAGDTPETSYRVVTDASVNTPVSLDQGRFIVELRVAPSLPMTFITVRLVQNQDEGISIIEA